MSKLLALIFRKAVALREESYDKEAADAATAKDAAEREAEPDNPYAGMCTDYATFYRKTMREAADESAASYGEPAMGEVVYYLMTYVWNDMGDWAKDQCK